MTNTMSHNNQNSADIRKAVVEIRHLKKTFGTKEVLSDINMDLFKGENLVVLGKSGQGKSVSIKGTSEP